MTAARRWFPWLVAAFGFGTLVAARVFEYAYGRPHEDTAFFIPTSIGGAAMLVIGALIATRTTNRLGWILLVIPVLTGVSVLTSVFVDASEAGSLTLDATLVGWLGWLGDWPFFAALGLLVAVFYLFPTGVVPSARWRWPWRAYVIAMITTVGGFMVLPTGEYPPNPMAIEALEPILSPVLALSGMLIVLSAFGAFASLVARYRAGDEEARQQLRWLFLVAAVGVVLFLMLLTLGIVFGDEQEGLAGTLAEVALILLVTDLVVGIPVATGIAIFRYHLYELNLVVRKTIVVASLAVFITVVYVAIVVGIGAIAGSSGGEVLPVAATATVALLFEPARERAHRLANRLVYGARATPYEVIAGFSSRMSSTVSTDDVLPEMAQAAGQGVGAVSAEVSVTLPGGREATERWHGDGAAPGLPTTFPISYRGEVIGALSVTKSVSEPLTRAEESLLTDLAGHAGLALHNVRLTEELQIRLRELDEQATALRVSRERLVTARDAQRRALQRDLYEGPEKELIAIGQRLAQADGAGPDDVVATLDASLLTASETLEGLRDLARGIFPPLLSDRGIVAALAAHIRKVGANVTVSPLEGFEGMRFDADVEACVYFCCLQTIQNVIRHAGNAPCSVTLESSDDRVRCAIRDEGPGYDASDTPRGMGLAIVQDRVDAMDGSLEVSSEPGSGTTVSIDIPATALSGVPA
jgi:signal transduction histidine kinase